MPYAPAALSAWHFIDDRFRLRDSTDPRREFEHGADSAGGKTLANGTAGNAGGSAADNAHCSYPSGPTALQFNFSVASLEVLVA